MDLFKLQKVFDVSCPNRALNTVALNYISLFLFLEDSTQIRIWSRRTFLYLDFFFFKLELNFRTKTFLKKKKKNPNSFYSNFENCFNMQKLFLIWWKITWRKIEVKVKKKKSIWILITLPLSNKYHNQYYCESFQIFKCRKYHIKLLTMLWKSV